MSRFRDRPLFRLALIGALAASAGLTACGRKGPLDAPPGASLQGEPQVHIPGLTSTNTNAAPIGSQPTGNNPGVAADGAPKGAKKHIPLDVLLN